MTYGELRALPAGWVTSHVIEDAFNNARFELGKNFKNEPVSESDLRTIREKAIHFGEPVPPALAEVAATSLIGATKTIYTQRSRKDGDNGAWTMGVESYNRVEIVHNIMETIERKHGWESEEAEADGLQQLLQYGRIHIYTITYDVLDSSEPV